MKRLRLPKPPRKKKSGRGKAKGGSYERATAKKLSLWLSHGANDSLLWRSAGSGSRATQSKRKEVVAVQGGDLSAVHPDAHKFISVFYVECKNYKEFLLDQLLGQHKGKFLPLWNKCVEEAKQANKTPLLIGKQSRGQELVFTNGIGFEKLSAASMDLQLQLWCPQYDLWVLILVDVLSHVEPDLLQASRIGTSNDSTVCGSSSNQQTRRRL